MTFIGARARTAAEMRKVLHFPLPDERLHAAYAARRAALDPGPRQLHVANALWGQVGYSFQEDFLRGARTCYGARAESVDFNDREAACKTINGWVRERTKERIEKLITPGLIVPSLTKLVLTNAIYFKGQWQHAFDKTKTRNAPFTLLDGKQVQVAMMHSGTILFVGRVVKPEKKPAKKPAARG